MLMASIQRLVASLSRSCTVRIGLLNALSARIIASIEMIFRWDGWSVEQVHSEIWSDVLRYASVKLVYFFQIFASPAVTWYKFMLLQTRLATSNPEFTAAVQESLGTGKEVIRPDGDVDLPRVRIYEGAWASNILYFLRDIYCNSDGTYICLIQCH